MVHRVLFLPGDGVGHELLAAARLVLQATKVRMEIETMDYGKTYERTCGLPVSEKPFGCHPATGNGVERSDYY